MLILALQTILFLFMIVKHIFVQKRPLFYPFIYFFGVYLLVLSPLILSSWRSSETLTFRMVTSLIIIFLGVGVYIWGLIFGGYRCTGIAYDSFANALQYSLTKLNLDVEEESINTFTYGITQYTIKTIKFSSVDTTLHVSTSKRWGMGSLKLKEMRNQHILRKIIQELNKYYTENTIKMKYTNAVLLVIFHLFILALVIFILFY